MRHCIAQHSASSVLRIEYIMETRVRRSKVHVWRTFGKKCMAGLIFGVLLITVYANLFDAVSHLDTIPQPDAFSSANRSGSDRGSSDIVTALLLRAEGPVKIRRAENSSERVEMVLTVDSDDLQDMVDEYRQSISKSKPIYPSDTTYLLNNPDLCKDSPTLDWIVYIHSGVFNYERRQLLRDTWANQKLFKNYKFRVIFLVGLSESEDDQSILKDEFNKFGDIIQGNFHDDYKNLTFKAVMGLKWISTYCPQARYGLKADDDTFMNIFAVAREMTKHKNSTATIICPLWGDNTMPILRERKSCMKWCVRKRDLPGRSYFPQYCAGIGFAISSPLIESLYQASKSTPFFWIDDVYITGLLLKKVKEKVEFVNMIDRFTLKEDKALEQMGDLSVPMTYHFVHTHNRHTYLGLWNKLLDRLEAEDKAELAEDPSHYKIDMTL